MVQIRLRVIAAILASVVLATTASCRRSRPQNEVFRHGDDVVASGSAPTVTDSVSGDAILAGRDARFSGAAGGDYLGAGGKQSIGGRIHGSVRAAGGEIHLAAVVDRNVTIAGGNVYVDSAADIGRNAYVAGGNVQVLGAVRGGLVASGGTVVLNGIVNRDVEVNAGALRVGPNAVITGNLRYRVPARKVQIDRAARISGKIIALPVSRGWGLWHLLWILGFLVAGGVAVALFPRFTAEAAEIIPRRPGRAALVGVVWAILVPCIIFVAAITVIGLPLALLLTAVYIVLACLASVPFSVWLGRRLLGARALAGRQGLLLSFLIGGLILLVVGLLPVVGGLVKLVAGLFGLGAILIRAQAMRERRPIETEL
jgi:hypothetical protein